MTEAIVGIAVGCFLLGAWVALVVRAIFAERDRRRYLDRELFDQVPREFVIDRTHDADDWFREETA